MTTIILTWFKEPLSFKFALDEDIRGGEYGVVQRELIPVLRSIPNVTFNFKAVRFEIEDRQQAIPFLIQSLTTAGYTILHKGDVPAEIEAAERPN